VRVNKPASALDKLRGGLEGPPLSSLVRLHDLAAWLNAELTMHDPARAEATVRTHLVDHAACAVYWLPPGQAPQLLPPAGPVPVEPGRRVLSRGLDGGAVRQPAQAAAIGPGNPPQRAWALGALQLAAMAVNRAEACALFGYPLPVEALPAAAPEPQAEGSPLVKLRKLVDTLQPVQRPAGSKRWPGGLVAAQARMLDHYQQCMAIPGVSRDDVFPELLRVWASLVDADEPDQAEAQRKARDTLDSYIKAARKANRAVAKALKLKA
jgi:hypothetical protein